MKVLPSGVFMADETEVSAFSKFWTKVMSGSDNETPAIGRYLGAIHYLVFLGIIPLGLMLAMKFHWTHLATVTALLAALPLYVAAQVAGVITLIRVLNSTEPKGPTNG